MRASDGRCVGRADAERRHSLAAEDAGEFPSRRNELLGRMRAPLDCLLPRRQVLTGDRGTGGEILIEELTGRFGYRRHGFRIEVAPFQWTVCQLAVYVLVMSAS